MPKYIPGDVAFSTSADILMGSLFLNAIICEHSSTAILCVYCVKHWSSLLSMCLDVGKEITKIITEGYYRNLVFAFETDIRNTKRTVWSVYGYPFHSRLFFRDRVAVLIEYISNFGLYFNSDVFMKMASENKLSYTPNMVPVLSDVLSKNDNVQQRYFPVFDYYKLRRLKCVVGLSRWFEEYPSDPDWIKGILGYDMLKNRFYKFLNHSDVINLSRGFWTHGLHSKLVIQSLGERLYQPSHSKPLPFSNYSFPSSLELNSRASNDVVSRQSFVPPIESLCVCLSCCGDVTEQNKIISDKPYVTLLSKAPISQQAECKGPSLVVSEYHHSTSSDCKDNFKSTKNYKEFLTHQIEREIGFRLDQSVLLGDLIDSLFGELEILKSEVAAKEKEVNLYYKILQYKK